MKVIGLTGGIASGKSTISNLLKDMGIPVIDGDKIARDVLINNPLLLDRIASVFGSQILNDDGSLNRKLLGNIVFNNNLSAIDKGIYMILILKK
jgi:dephospho-CoA kinase